MQRPHEWRGGGISSGSGAERSEGLCASFYLGASQDS